MLALASSSRAVLMSGRAALSASAAARGRDVFVVGVGMTKFEKPGGREGWDYPDMVREAGAAAFADASRGSTPVTYADIEQVAVGYVYGPSTCGQRAVYELGLSGVPMYNLNNNCSTGSTALFLAKQLVEGGIADCAMAVGFEKMQRGSLDLGSDDRANPVGRHMEKMVELTGKPTGPPAPWLFGAAGTEHMQRYGTTAEQFGMVAEKNHRHSANNPYAQFRDVYSLEEIMAAKTITGPLTKLQCSPTSDGAAAAIVCSEEFVRAHGLEGQAIRIAGMGMATDMESTFDETSDAMKVVGSDMTRKAAGIAFEQAGLTPEDVQVVELHDCFSANELITYEALGLCGEGEGGQLVESGNCTYGGKYVVNPSGGLISKGHPLGATGLAQCAELTWQLRGEAEARQVDNVSACLQHNLGLGGAAVVTVYSRMEQ